MRPTTFQGRQSKGEEVDVTTGNGNLRLSRKTNRGDCNNQNFAQKHDPFIASPPTNRKMMRLLLLCFATLFACTNAWTMTGSRVSSFGGSVLMTATAPTTSSSPLEMKKGKPNVPVNMRGDYRRQKELSQMRDQMLAASKTGPDGLPVFNLFVRTKKANVRAW
jgi:hypothetical protein